MPKHVAYALALAAAVVTFSAGCDSMPQQELVRAKESLDSARAIEAVYYCEELFAQAQGLFDSAAAVITTQQRRMKPLRSYGKARLLLDSAAALAREACRVLPDKRSTYAIETRKLLNRATDVVQATEKLAADEARKGKRTAALQAEMTDMKELLVAARAASDGGDHVRARSMATSIIDRASAYRNLLPQLPTPAVKLTAGTRKQ